MEHDEWSKLQKEMAIEALILDYREFCPRMPVEEAREKSILKIEHKEQEALSKEWMMGQALIALENLGYKIQK
jgi:hypothetical protein